MGGLSDDSARKSGSLVSNSTGSLNISDAVAISTSGESIEDDEQQIPSVLDHIRNMRNRPSEAAPPPSARELEEAPEAPEVPEVQNEPEEIQAEAEEKKD